MTPPATGGQPQRDQSMSDMKNQMIELIRHNRISTSEISDCLGKTGEIKRITALNPGHFCVGPIRFVYAYNCSNWELHEQMTDVQDGEVVVVEDIDCQDFALFGALVAKYALLYRGAAALAVKGLLRDAHTLKKENYPIWVYGVTPTGCFNRKNEQPPEARRLEELRAPYEGGIAVCDDSGVVVIPKQRINAEFMEKLHWIELQEDAWFHSIDTDGFSTYETVCQRRYLEEGSVFSKYERLKHPPK